MALNRMFVKARIEERSGIYVAVITYSFYGVYHYDEVSVHDNLNDATEHLLKQRCNGSLTLAQPKK